MPARSEAPTLDGRADEREYGPPTVRLATGAGEVRLWIVRTPDALHVAASLPDTTRYWGDDVVVSLDADGSADAAPAPGDRQWYLRRVLDSSVVGVASGSGARWYASGAEPPALGARRAGDAWAVASTTHAAGWDVELRIDAAALTGARGLPRIAVRTYDDRPHGWWSWPAPPAGVPAVRVERSPALWTPLRVPTRR